MFQSETGANDNDTCNEGERANVINFRGKNPEKKRGKIKITFDEKHCQNFRSVQVLFCTMSPYAACQIVTRVLMSK